MSLARYLSRLANLIGSDGKVPQAALAANVAGNGPAFRAYLNSSDQATTSTTNTKVALDTEVYDTASCFNNTSGTVGGIPAYAFKPTVAGYYQFSASIYGFAQSGLAYNYVQIYKNGAQDASAIYGPYSTTTQIGSVSALIYLNGTTDYVELYDQISGTGTCQIKAGSGFTFFSGALVRAA